MNFLANLIYAGESGHWVLQTIKEGWELLLYMLCSLLISLISVFPSSCLVHCRHTRLPAVPLTHQAAPRRRVFALAVAVPGALFPGKRGLPTLFIHCTDAPPQKPLPRPSRLSKLMCIYFMSPSWISSDSITANFMSLVLCWVDPSKVQNETHLPPQRCFCHSLHFSTGKMHPTTTWSQPFGVLSFLYTQHPISNFVGSAFKNIS